MASTSTWLLGEAGIQAISAFFSVAVGRYDYEPTILGADRHGSTTWEGSDEHGRFITLAMTPEAKGYRFESWAAFDDGQWFVRGPSESWLLDEEKADRLSAIGDTVAEQINRLIEYAAGESVLRMGELPAQKRWDVATSPS